MLYSIKILIKAISLGKILVFTGCGGKGEKEKEPVHNHDLIMTIQLLYGYGANFY